MIVRKSLRTSRGAACLVLLLGSHAGCFPNFDELSSARDDGGSSGASTGGALSGSAGIGGTTGSGTGGDGGEAADAGRGGSDTGGTGKGGSHTGGTGKGGSSTGGTATGGKGGSSTGGAGGKGGSAGTGGSGMTGLGGNAGTGGVATSGGAGAGGAGGQAGACMEGSAGSATATGVEVLTVPLMSNGQGQRYNVQNRTSPSMPFDLSGATLTIRAYAPCAIGGNLSIFFRSPSATESAVTRVALSTLTGGFVDIPVPVPEAAGTFDPTMVDIIRLEVEADSAYGSTFQSPATIVYIDSIVSSNGAVTYPFDAAPVHIDFGDSGARPLEGSMFWWRAAYP